jgi:hypothetical protein
MELEELRDQWTKLKAPAYTHDELVSIYNIKQGNVLQQLKAALKADLVIALVIAAGFVIGLQGLNLRTSNVWSYVMIYVAIQHVIIYLMQASLINKFLCFTTDVAKSIDHSIHKLVILLWFYRVTPVVLTFALILLYKLNFGIPLSTTWLWGTSLLVLLVVSLLSEFISARLIHTRISELVRLRKDLNKR